MRAAEDIRRWLYERNYPVLDDRVVYEAGRYYQVFSIGQPLEERQSLPQGWPEDCFLLGYTAFARREPLMKPLADRMLASVQKKRRTQRSDALDRQMEQLQQILSNWEEQP
jgi:tRNA A22 N-methylase